MVAADVCTLCKEPSICWDVNGHMKVYSGRSHQTHRDHGRGLQ